MTREQFIADHRDRIMGMVLDAYLSTRAGAELSLALRGASAKTDGLLGEMFDQLQKQFTPPTRPGNPAPPPTAAPPRR